LGERFLAGQQPGLEAQLANLADEIAYNNHDVDDGLRAGLLTVDELCSVELFRDQYERVRGNYPNISDRALVHETVRGMINRIVTDLLDASRQGLQAADPEDIDDVRGRSCPLIGFSPEVHEEHRALKRFLKQSLYRHERVQEMTRRADRIVRGLFELYFDDPAMMPDEHANKASALEQQLGAAGRARAVTDYVAGMTDRYALSAYRRLIDGSQRMAGDD
jgi:dGTPase